MLPYPAVAGKFNVDPLINLHLVHLRIVLIWWNCDVSVKLKLDPKKESIVSYIMCLTSHSATSEPCLRSIAKCTFKLFGMKYAQHSTQIVWIRSESGFSPKAWSLSWVQSSEDSYHSERHWYKTNTYGSWIILRVIDEKTHSRNSIWLIL